jgi:hypothetical protein
MGSKQASRASKQVADGTVLMKKAFEQVDDFDDIHGSG